MKEHCKFIILGAGPTGLGAAHRWVEAVSDECLILEATNLMTAMIWVSETVY